MTEHSTRGVRRGRKHVLVREYVRSVIVNAEPGTPAPSERDLAEQFGVARMTVRHAIDVQRMDAQRIGKTMAVRQITNGIEVARVDRRQHHLGHAGLARTADYLVAVVGEFGRIEVAMGIDPGWHPSNDARTPGVRRMQDPRHRDTVGPAWPCA